MKQLIKLCGLVSDENFKRLKILSIDMIGLNFYHKSPRFLDNRFDKELLRHIPDMVQRAGVFVNASLDYILEKSREFELDFVQLHGDESPEFGFSVFQEGIKVIKAFQVDENFEWDQLQGFDYSSYFLFDSRSKQYGGSGKKFNWDLLLNYKLSIPFLLSGGIGPTDFEHLQTITGHPAYIGIDINSRFEISPGQKDMDLVNGFIQKLKLNQVINEK